ncbi:hypothetical protein TI39_contig630g00010 [Zymoseptoria brevis]|uniref:Peptidase M66 domain-containing protein n=1 Tax=Zymoseptoria brevis TaxID=1047168 RepID=A0A0F4GG74_9PEZI|nr:hypothetical protein TI39_contig630g00010 [Zymoseptoria brevis]
MLSFYLVLGCLSGALAKPLQQPSLVPEEEPQDLQERDDDCEDFFITSVHYDPAISVAETTTIANPNDLEPGTIIIVKPTVLDTLECGPYPTGGMPSRTNVDLSPTAQPGSYQYGINQPGNTKTGNAQYGNTQPGNTKPGNAQYGNIQPGNTQPGNTQPGNTQLGNYQPATGTPFEPELDEPEIIDSPQSIFQPGPGSVAICPGYFEPEDPVLESPGLPTNYLPGLGNATLEVPSLTGTTSTKITILPTTTPATGDDADPASLTATSSAITSSTAESSSISGVSSSPNDATTGVTDSATSSSDGGTTTDSTDTTTSLFSFDSTDAADPATLTAIDSSSVSNFASTTSTSGVSTDGSSTSTLESASDMSSDGLSTTTLVSTSSEQSSSSLSIETTSSVSGSTASAQSTTLTTATTTETISTSSGSTSTTSSSGTPSPTILVATMEFAQTHVTGVNGTSWTLGSNTYNLHLVGSRSALAIVRFPSNMARPQARMMRRQADMAITAPVVEAIRGGISLGTVELATPSSLPGSEADGAAYATDAWSADLPAAWIVPGTSFVVKATGYDASQTFTPAIGADIDMQLTILPVYLFGANEANTQPLSVTGTPNDAVRRELLAKWPLANLNIKQHPAGYVSWANLVIPPRKGLAAYVMTKGDQQKGTFDMLYATLPMIQNYMLANGEYGLAGQYFSPLLAIDSAGKYRGQDGGLGGGGPAGAGGFDYTGIFFHEQGHAFDLSHAGDEYNSGTFPYPAGSLEGSAWGYDAGRRQFLSPLVPSTARSFTNCAANHRLDQAGRCYKQDPMQSGSGDQDPSYRFAELADFNVARIQRWFEGVTITSSSGQNQIRGGKIFSSPDGLTRWDSIARARVPIPADNTPELGISGINGNLPIQRNVAVHALAFTISNAGTPGVTYLYEPLSFVGNLIRLFDPTNAQDLADINISGDGKYRWYCENSGCDYTIRVTYADGSVVHRVVQRAFRPFYTHSAVPPRDTTTNPVDGSSFRSFAMNVPGDQAISKVELLDTPNVSTGMAADPEVLASR